jgi:putative CocE/NonD family hydrolase
MTSSSTGATIDFDVMVPMRDGVQLAADIYRPSGGGRYPVLVYRTPYGKAGPSVLIDRLVAVKRGYALVSQDTRGRYASGGSFVPFLAHESEDGYDTVEWAAAQPWSDGNVGVYGASAMGVTAIQAAVAAPPHLRAAMAYVGGANLHNGWIYANGVLELGFAIHWTLFSLRAAETVEKLNIGGEERKKLLETLAVAQANRWDTVRHLPLSGIAAFDKRVSPHWLEWLSHPGYDEYWRHIDAARRADAIRVPLLHGTGWYDNFLPGHLDLQAKLQGSKDQAVKSQHRFFVGPWEHLSYVSENPSVAGERNFGPNAIGGPGLLPELLFDWFAHWLKGNDLRVVSRSPVRFFVTGENQWREAEEWPPATQETKYYLGSRGRANSRLGDGDLSNSIQSDQPPDTFVYDPHNPVPSVGGRSLHREWGPAGVYDQAQVELRDDVLVYTSPFLSEPIAVAGRVSVVLYASTSAADTDFTAKLIDVELDGYCANLAEGIVRARFREGADHEAWIEPGVVVAYTINLWDIAHTFDRGHRVRLEVSSSNFPRFDRNLNSRVSPELASESDLVLAVQKIWHDKAHASFLRLPVLVRSVQSPT